MIHILHFFLRHLILIGVLVWLGLGLYFHEALFPGLKLPELAAKVQPAPKAAKPTPPASAPAATPEAPAAAAPAPTPEQPPQRDEAEIEDPAAISAPLMEPQTDQAESPVVSPASSPQVQPVEAFQFRPEDTEPAKPEDAHYLNLMNQARSLTEKEDWPGAEAAYLRLVLEFPERAEPYGELGNLYLYSKDNVKAADAYWQAALRLKGEDQAQRLQSLLDVLDQIDPDKARKLREQIATP